MNGSPWRSNFYLSFWALSRPQREAITAVYRWCRVVDDVVDQPSAGRPPSSAAQGLAWWRREVAQTFQGRPTHPVMVKLLPVIERYHPPEGYFQAVLDGVSMDLERRRYATFEELYPYCYRVAGVVGLLCLAIFTGGARTHPETMLGKRSLGGRAEARKASDGILDDGTVCRASLRGEPRRAPPLGWPWRGVPTPPQAALPRLQPEEGFGMSSKGQAPDQQLQDYAVNLGIAFQLTNILRDVKSDGARGRLYLPQEDLERCQCPEQDLLAGRCTAAVRQTLEATISRARRYYAQAEALLRPQDVRTLLAAEMMAAVYRRLLDKIAHDPCRIWQERVRLPLLTRCWVVGTTWACLVWRSFRSPHRILAGLVALAFTGLAGCATTPMAPSVRRAIGGWPSPLDLEAKLQSSPLPPDQNIRVDELGRDQHISQHLVQLRDRERPHVHAKHDLTAVLLRGHGTMVVGRHPFSIRVGDVVVIPQGTAHYFVNESTAPTVGYVIFAPPFDGRDYVETPSLPDPSPFERLR
ncbi:MAG: squalene/phytoene synthase family protein [Elusimicrobia bacterium]|nr:squalene/phytoene synthase family protein [Elusimicrobiota bacterium]